MGLQLVEMLLGEMRLYSDLGGEKKKSSKSIEQNIGLEIMGS